VDSVQQQNLVYGFSLKEPQEGTMKKQLLKSALIAVAGVGLLAGSAMATLPTLGGTYQWTNSDYWTVTDLANGQAQFELLWENPNASFESSLGIYSLSDPTTIFAAHEIFTTLQEPVVNDTDPSTPPLPDTAASIWFKWSGTTWQISSTKLGTYTDFGDVFGFYSDVDTDKDGDVDYTWYSDTFLQNSKNGNSNEHFFIAYDSKNHATLIYLEDLPQGNVGSDNVDLMVTTSDISPIPEPATMLLFGTGLSGLAAFARRRK
jgi:hypothetical protein